MRVKFSRTRLAFSTNAGHADPSMIRDREKVMRGLKNVDTPILKGYQIFHNYLRPHEGLDGKTPAEACGIEVQGDNKWVTLIQNASLSNRKLTAKGDNR